MLFAESVWHVCVHGSSRTGPCCRHLCFSGRFGMQFPRSSLAALTLLLLALSAPTVTAQTTYATITGTVTDMSGGVINGATVVAMNVETAVTTKTTTNNEGVY